MRRDIVWEFVDRPGLEHLVLDLGDREVAADGVVLVDLGQGTLSFRYALSCAADWQLRSGRFSLEGAGQKRQLELKHDDAGRWYVDGKFRPDLEGCSYIDIMATPFTNTLPIRRLGLAHGERQCIRVAYLSLPDLAVKAAEQAYTRLDPAEPPRRFRYHGLFRDFVADLVVDDDGVVIDYPPVWRRRSG